MPNKAFNTPFQVSDFEVVTYRGNYSFTLFFKVNFV